MTERLNELEQERDFLMLSLDDLEAERAAGEIDDKDYEELRDAYTARAAAVLRAIDGEDETPFPGESEYVEEAQAARAHARRKRTQRTVGAVVLVALLAGAIGALVATFAGERTPGQQVSGSIGGSQETKLARARQLLGQGNALEAIKTYDSVLRSDPANAEALAYRGWLLKLAGLWERGLESIDKAIAADPSFPDAHFFRGMILEQDKKDPAAAVTELRTFLASNPQGDLVPMVQQVLDRALKEAGQQQPPPQQSS
jgi:tetratricopeptide (TPR) repeat protein